MHDVCMYNIKFILDHTYERTCSSKYTHKHIGTYTRPDLGKLRSAGYIPPFMRPCPAHEGSIINNINRTRICLFLLFDVCGDQQVKNDFSLIQQWLLFSYST